MSLGQTVIAVGAVATSLATLSVWLRCISRFRILRKPSMDDHLVMASIMLSWILYGFVASQVHYGLGRHYDRVPIENFVMILKYTWICSDMYNLALTTTKLSAIFQFLRFAVALRSRTAGYTLMVIDSAYGTAVSLGFVFSCHPVAFYWNKSIRNGQCVDIVKFSICNVILNVTTDLAAVALPLHVLKGLRLSKRDKLAVQSTFAVGGMTCFTSFFRLHFSTSTDKPWITLTISQTWGSSLSSSLTSALLVPVCQLSGYLHNNSCRDYSPLVSLYWIKLRAATLLVSNLSRLSTTVDVGRTMTLIS